MDKSQFTEADIRTKCILPALQLSGWDIRGPQVREEVQCTDGRIFVKGSKSARGKRKVADIVLYYKPNIPIAVIEAKDNSHSAKAGIQQAEEYADMLDVPSIYSCNGDGFHEHDRSDKSNATQKELAMDQFPNPQELWERYKKYKNLTTPEHEKIAAQGYFQDSEDKQPRYYQQVAINRVVEAIARGQNRLLLAMATGTGKTYTAFQIIHRLWKSGAKKRVLFLADRNALIDQTRRGEFSHFGDKLTIIRGKQVDKAYQVYLALYQQLVTYDGSEAPFREFSPNFFDLIVVDECHRGSAKDDSEWRTVLEYFDSATQIGLTATPKETKYTSNIGYFGEPVYIYSLKQGIQDGFLAPYKVLRVSVNVDEGWRPEEGKKTKTGELVEDREYNSNDYDKNLVIDERTEIVARRVSEFLRKTNRMDKTIIFCVDIEHAERMREAIANENGDLMGESRKYVMQITGDNKQGIQEIDSFTDPGQKYPVIATTSQLLSTGVDTQTCKLIVLDKNIHSMTEFKQIIGRGTRIRADYGKTFFTIMDFRKATNIFADPDFDGDPVQVMEVGEKEEISDTEEDVDNPIIYDNGEEVIFDDEPQNGGATPGGVEEEDPVSPKGKQYVDGVDVVIMGEHVRYLDASGKLIFGSLTSYTKKKALERYQSLNNFLNEWNAAKKKRALIEELTEQGISYDDLKEAVNKDMDLFDIICHLAFDRPALTRAERAKNVKKRDCFGKYGEKAREVLNAILDKYADEGIESIEDAGILRVAPFDDIGTPVEIINLFGGKMKYRQAIAELQKEIYKAA